MRISKEETLQMLVRARKIDCTEEKYNFTTKTKCFCLSCLSPIYLSYKEYGVHSIFCPLCLQKFYHKATIVQHQYIRIIKERQLAFIESHTKKNQTLKLDI